MSANLYEWIIVLAFVLLVIGFIFAETAWLNKKGWADFGRAFVFAALSNFIGLAVGFFVVFIVMLIAMMLVFDGSIQKSPVGEPVLIVVLILAALFVPIFLTICKRIFLSLLKIRTGKAAWFYALPSSVLILVFSLGIPILIGYLLY